MATTSDNDNAAAASTGAASVSAVGDLYIGKAFHHEMSPAFLSAVALFKASDVRLANLECQLISGDMPGAAQAAGAWAGAPHALGRELSWLSVNAVSTANNHAGDYGAQGQRSTEACLRQLGIAHAGTGETLAAARQATYINTPGGAVALIGIASSFLPHARAGRQRDDVPGRSGVSPLRFGTRYHVDAQSYRALERILEKLPIENIEHHRERPLQRNYDDERNEALSFLGHAFVNSDTFRVESWAADDDVREIEAEIALARKAANWVIVSLHTHEFDGAENEPAGFAIEFCRKCVDAGADVIVGHGHHGVRGVEVYRGKPIFYGLGPFVFQPYLYPRQPSDFFEAYEMQDASLEQVYRARCERAGFFAHRRHWEAALVQIQLDTVAAPAFQIHPVSLWEDGDASPTGIPHLARNASGLAILKKIADLSRRLGTTLTLDQADFVLRNA